MKIINVFDAVKEGNFEKFQRMYTGNINEINEFTRLNLLQTIFLMRGMKKKGLKSLIIYLKTEMY